jgi:6-pyruvoyl-tetrahydropterin synthase
MCDKNFTQTQYNKEKLSRLCQECKESGGSCVVCDKNIKFGNAYCKDCYAEALKTDLFNHSQQAISISGDNNPAKKIEVKKLIVEQMKKRQQGLHGLKSKFELEIKEKLDKLGISYEYEKFTLIDDKAYYPDFVLDNNFAIIVAGWIWEDKKEEHLKRYFNEISALTKKFNHVIVVTYNEFTNYFTEQFKSIPNKVSIVAYNSINNTQTIFKENICNVDYSHFLYFHESLCHKVHGHTSWGVSLFLEGYPVKGMLIDYGNIKKIVSDVMSVIDHKILINETHITEEVGDIYIIEYVSDKFHRLELPKDEVYVINFEPTLENILRHFSEKILSLMPNNISGIGLIMQEGVNNGAMQFLDRNAYSFDKLENIILFNNHIDRVVEKKCSQCGRHITYSEWCTYHFKKRRDFCSQKCYKDFFLQYIEDDDGKVKKKKK